MTSYERLQRLTGREMLLTEAEAKNCTGWKAFERESVSEVPLLRLEGRCSIIEVLETRERGFPSLGE
jgi:hypothetical protein